MVSRLLAEGVMAAGLMAAVVLLLNIWWLRRHMRIDFRARFSAAPMSRKSAPLLASSVFANLPLDRHGHALAYDELACRWMVWGRPDALSDAPFPTFDHRDRLAPTSCQRVWRRAEELLRLSRAASN